MMTNSIYGMTNYYNLFTSPLKSYQDNPTSSLIYGALANKSYMNTFANKLTSEMSSYLSSLNSNISDLKSASKSLTEKGPVSSFDQKTVTSSDSTSVSGTASADADVAAYTLKVSKLAKSQVNSGNALTSSDKSIFSQGGNTFTLKVGNKSEKNISVHINENDTNKSSLDKIASSINYAKLGVTASVVNDKKAGTSYLKIMSDKTGTDASFSISDKTGNAAEVAGANQTTTQAQNAEYTVDGKQNTSQQNNITLNNGKVSLTLNKADNKDIKLSVGADTSAIKADIKNYINAYNKTINLTNDYSTSFNGATKLKDELGSIVNSKKSTLESIGITENSDGSLSLDDKKLDKALSKNLSIVKDAFGGYNGVAENTYTKSNEVLNSPKKYSNPTDVNKNYNSSYQSSSFVSGFTSIENMYRGLVVDMLL